MLQAIAEVILEVFVQVLCGLTGHALLWVLTIGRWKPLGGRDELATIVGFLLWVGLGLSLFYWLQ